MLPELADYMLVECNHLAQIGKDIFGNVDVNTFSIFIKH